MLLLLMKFIGMKSLELIALKVILEWYLNEAALLYICESGDGKQHMESVN